MWRGQWKSSSEPDGKGGGLICALGEGMGGERRQEAGRAGKKKSGGGGGKEEWSTGEEVGKKECVLLYDRRW